MLIGFDKGHTLRGVGTGAVGIKSETGLNRPLGVKVINKFRQLGHTVIDCTVDEGSNSLAQICANANRQKIDLFVSLHFNCGGGNGVEVLTYDNKSTVANNYATKICNEISKLGYKNRGVKYRPELYVLNSTNAQALLIEVAFIDSQYDMSIYDEEKVANAIVYAITGQIVQDQPAKRYYVKTGDFLSTNGIELNALRNKYFYDLERVYAYGNGNYINFATQYLSREKCNEIINRLAKDGLYASTVEE